jgi:hypothetical protein
MLTIFAIPKPFHGHQGMIQANAIGSWSRLNTKCEVVLFGDDSGTREISKEFQLRHEPDIRRNEFGTPLLGPIFARAQELATHDLLCYVNCDILLLPCFSQAVLRVARTFPKFLMVGRRWNTPVTQPIEFQRLDWESQIRAFARHSGRQDPPYAIDYFVFPRGLYDHVPPFAVGRFYWDHWLAWKPRSMKVPVVDASAAVLAIHQEHGFPGHPARRRDERTDAEAKRNRTLAGSRWHLYTIQHSTHRLLGTGIAKQRGSWHVPVTSLLGIYSRKLWYWFLTSTFYARRTVGLYRRVASNNSAD